MKWTPEEIKRRRAARGLNQTELGRLLADVLGEEESVSRRAITNWENGRAEPRGKNLHALDQVLGDTTSDDVTLKDASMMQLLAEIASRYAELEVKTGHTREPDLDIGDWKWKRSDMPSARRLRDTQQGDNPNAEQGRHQL